MDCIFCAIVEGKLPSARIYEDDRAVAFMDIQPGNPGHALVVPRLHARDVFDIDPETLAHVVRVAQKVAVAARQALGCDGINLIQSSGAAAFQSVYHVHFHVLPRFEGDDVRLPWKPKRGEPDAIEKAAAALRAQLVVG